jgi:hypothetical protein
MDRLCRTTALAFLIAMTLLYPLLAPPVHRIDDSHYRRIKVGMTEADVEAIFGVHPGDYDWAVEEDLSPICLLRDATGGAYGMARLRFNGGRDVALCPIPYLFDDPTAVCVERACDLQAWKSRHGVFCVVLEHGRVVTTYHGGPTRLQPPWARWWRSLTRMLTID